MKAIKQWYELLDDLDGLSTGRSAHLVGDTYHGDGNASRREFLRATATVLGSLALPGCLRGHAIDDSRWVVHIATGDSWSVADPVAWSLENAHRTILGRASEGLRNLTPGDGERVIRLVTRRCALNLIELHPDRVVVHHWGQQGLADLRPFFKDKGLARREIEVVVRDRKREGFTTQTGDQYLYGEALAAGFPLGLYLGKWEQRFVDRPDDRLAAPGTSSGYAWEGVESNGIPWTAMKSAWRRTVPTPCPNCDGPTMLTNFGYRRSGMLGREPRFVHVCGPCRRSFQDHSVREVSGWMRANLDAEVLPEYVMIWNRRESLRPGELLNKIDERES
jgi:hypothetical protein